MSRKKKQRSSRKRTSRVARGAGRDALGVVDKHGTPLFIGDVVESDDHRQHIIVGPNPYGTGHVMFDLSGYPESPFDDCPCEFDADLTRCSKSSPTDRQMLHVDKLGRPVYFGDVVTNPDIVQEKDYLKSKERAKLEEDAQHAYRIDDYDPESFRAKQEYIKRIQQKLHDLQELHHSLAIALASGDSIGYIPHRMWCKGRYFMVDGSQRDFSFDWNEIMKDTGPPHGTEVAERAAEAMAKRYSTTSSSDTVRGNRLGQQAESAGRKWLSSIYRPDHAGYQRAQADWLKQQKGGKQKRRRSRRKTRRRPSKKK